MANSSGSSPFLGLINYLLGILFPWWIPAVMKRKALVIIFRPRAAMEAAASNQWKNPDDLIAGYIEKMKEVSDGLLVYQVVERQEVDYYPLLEDGRRYDDPTWTQVLAKTIKPFFRPNSPPDKPILATADYGRIIQDFNLLQKVKDWKVDEVWMFGGPYFGFYESCMVGRGAFWCNGPEIKADTRRFVIMGFNYEREVKEMVHDYGHRTESILARKFNSGAFLGLFYPPDPKPDEPPPTPPVIPPPKNEFEQFLLDHGTVHQVPGGKDYSQDEFAWLSTVKRGWWTLTIEPDRVKTR